MEVIRDRKKFLPEFAENSDLHSGDIERVDIEWKSLLSLIAFAPPLKLPRWLELQKMASQIIGDTDVSEQLPDLPDLLSRQRERFVNSGVSSAA